jgi:hypothetical protein
VRVLRNSRVSRAVRGSKPEGLEVGDDTWGPPVGGEREGAARASVSKLGRDGPCRLHVGKGGE